MKAQAVLFDLDGTLLDTVKDLGTATNAVLARFGYPTHPVEAYRAFVGNGVATLARRALPPGEEARLGAEGLRRLMEAVLAAYPEHAKGSAVPYDGIAELLAFLRSRGIARGVLSNKPHAATVAAISHFFPDGGFAPVLGAVPDKPLKPDPSRALEMAAAWNVPPGSVLYLGDTDVDMLTATAAGMYPVGAGWGFRGEEELRAAGAAVICATPREVIPLLAG